MKKFERIVGIIAIFGIILKILNIPGSSILNSLALTMLSMLYYAFSFALFNGIRLRNIFKKAAYKETNTNAKRIIGAIGLGWALSAIIIGGLFKLQSWPGANVQLMSGLATLGLILLIATIFYFRNNAEYYKRIFKRSAIYGGLGLILYLTPTTFFQRLNEFNLPEKNNSKLLSDLQSYQINDFQTIYYNSSMPIEDVRIVGNSVQRLKGYFPDNQRIDIIFQNNGNNYSIKFFVPSNFWQEPAVVDRLKSTTEYIKNSGIEKPINLVLIDNQSHKEKQITN